MLRVYRFLIAALSGGLLLASAAFAQPPADAVLPPSRMQLFTAAGGPCCGETPYCRNWWAVDPGAVHLRWQGHCGRDCNYQQDIGGCDCGHRCGRGACCHRCHSCESNRCGTWLDRLVDRCIPGFNPGGYCLRSCGPSCSSNGCTSGCTSGCASCPLCESKGCACKPVGCDTRPTCASADGDRQVNPFGDDPTVLPMPQQPMPRQVKPMDNDPSAPPVPEPDQNTGSTRSPSIVTASFSAPAKAVAKGAPALNRRGIPAPVIIAEEVEVRSSTAAKGAPSRVPVGTTLRVREVRDVQP